MADNLVLQLKSTNRLSGTLKNANYLIQNVSPLVINKIKEKRRNMMVRSLLTNNILFYAFGIDATLPTPPVVQLLDGTYNTGTTLNHRYSSYDENQLNTLSSGNYLNCVGYPSYYMDFSQSGTYQTNPISISSIGHAIMTTEVRTNQTTGTYLNGGSQGVFSYISYSNGSNKYDVSSGNVDTYFGGVNAPFTLVIVIRPYSSSPSNGGIFSLGGAGSGTNANSYGLNINSTQITWGVSSGTLPYAYTSGIWTTLAYVYDGTNLALYVNGVYNSQVAISITNLNTTLYLGLNNTSSFGTFDLANFVLIPNVVNPSTLLSLGNWINLSYKPYYNTKPLVLTSATQLNTNISLSNLSLNGNYSMSVRIDFYTSSFTNEQVLVSLKGDYSTTNTTYDNMTISITSSAIKLYTSYGTSYGSSVISPSINTWNQVVITYNASTNLISFYLNGTAVGTSVSGGIISASYIRPITFGGRTASQLSSAQFYGRLRNFQLYNYVLSGSNVSALSTQTTHLFLNQGLKVKCDTIIPSNNVNSNYLADKTIDFLPTDSPTSVNYHYIPQNTDYGVKIENPEIFDNQIITMSLYDIMDNQDFNLVNPYSMELTIF